MRATILGDVVPWWCPESVWAGYQDGKAWNYSGVLYYRLPWWNRYGWRIGYFVGKQ
jgi:hypothetical protein